MGVIKQKTHHLKDAFLFTGYWIPLHYYRATVNKKWPMYLIKSQNIHTYICALYKKDKKQIKKWSTNIMPFYIQTTFSVEDAGTVIEEEKVTLSVAERPIHLSVLIRWVVSENLAYVVWQGNTSPFSYTIMQAHSNLDTMITRDANNTNKQTHNNNNNARNLCWKLCALNSLLSSYRAGLELGTAVEACTGWQKKYMYACIQI